MIYVVEVLFSILPYYVALVIDGYKFEWHESRQSGQIGLMGNKHGLYLGNYIPKYPPRKPNKLYLNKRL